MAATVNRKTPIAKKSTPITARRIGTNDPYTQLRVTALDTAARVLGGTTSSPTVILDAASQFYTFLTGK